MKLPRNAAAAFQLAAAELGMCSGARLFVTELLAAGGPDLLAEARERLGPEYPVFDVVASDALEGHLPPPIDASGAVSAVGSAEVLLVVGLEAYFLDALVAALRGVRIGLLLGEGGLEGETRRVLANFGDRVEEVTAGEVLHWAGRKSALLTFVYGTVSGSAHVTPVWLRVAGPDVRPQFRTIVGWDVLGKPPTLYPRWLVEAPLEPFSRVVA